MSECENRPLYGNSGSSRARHSSTRQAIFTLARVFFLLDFPERKENLRVVYVVVVVVVVVVYCKSLITILTLLIDSNNLRFTFQSAQLI